MITCYFGVPGSGKTTFLTKLAVRELKVINSAYNTKPFFQKRFIRFIGSILSIIPFIGRFFKSPKYKTVYTNFYCKGARKINFSDLNTLVVRDSLIILDEITLDADNRNFKSFPEGVRDFFILHRHLGNDIIYATQSYELVDKKIRQLTQDLWYLNRSVVPFFSLFTYSKRIYREININEHTSDLTLGYRFCNLLERFFVSNSKICLRMKYYKYFDSYDEGHLSSRLELNSKKWAELPPKRNILRYLKRTDNK